MKNRIRGVRGGPFAGGSTVVLLTMAIAILASGRSGIAEDVVTVKRSNAPGETRRQGTIIDYTGRTLTLRLPSGRDEQIESSRVTGYATELVPEHANADQMFAKGRFTDALVSYREAIQNEQRGWVRRVILARMARCYSNMQQIVQAGEAFRLLLQSDPETQLFGAIPLAWVSSTPSPDVVERANQWIGSSDMPAVQLMGASWLLGTAHRQRAIEVLGTLTAARDPRVAGLAEAQLWRDRLVTASLEESQRWEEQVRSLDVSLRAGPYFMLGQLLARHGLNKAAALAFVRVPVQYSAQQDLTAEALFAAGEQLEKAGEREEAQAVYQELAREHANHRLAPPARQRLRQNR